MKRKGRVILCLIIGLLSVLIFIKKITQAAMYAYDVCTLRQWVITYGSGDQIYTSSGYYWDCMTFYFYAPGGQNGGEPGGSGGGDDPGEGSGGGTIIPNHDTDKNNIIDCYKNIMFLSSNTLTVTSGFRPPNRPNHNGIDLGSVPDPQACYGRFIFSMCNGVVNQVYYSEDGGWTVIVVDDNGYHWGVCHLLSDPRTDSSVNLYEGKRVKVGIGILGRCDSTGDKCNGPHIHLSLRINGEYVDPLDKTKNYNINGC